MVNQIFNMASNKKTEESILGFYKNSLRYLNIKYFFDSDQLTPLVPNSKNSPAANAAPTIGPKIGTQL